MTSDEKTSLDEKTPEGVTEPSVAPQAGAETAPPAEPSVDARIAELADQVLRAQAEMENVRKRAQRDVESAHKFALERFAADLLGVVDNLERGLDAAREGASSGADKAIIEGIELSLKQFLDVLGRNGVAQIDPAGEPFDPKFHQAVSLIESPHAEPGSVMNVLQKGYLLNGRLLRPAMVMVAKAPESPATDTPPSDGKGKS